MKLLITNNEQDRATFDMAVWGPIIAAAEEVWIDDLCIKAHQAERPTVENPLLRASIDAYDLAEGTRRRQAEILRGLDAAAQAERGHGLAEWHRLLERDAAMVGMPPGGHPPDGIGEALRVSMQQVWWGALERWGADNIKSINDIVICGPLGRRHDYLTFWPAGGRVRTGCFEGTLDEFNAAVLKSYGDEILDLEGDGRGPMHGTPVYRAVLQLEAWRDQYLVTVDGWRQWQKNPRGQA